MIKMRIINRRRFYLTISLVICTLSIIGYFYCNSKISQNNKGLVIEKTYHIHKTKVAKIEPIKKDVDYWIKHYSKQYNLDWKLVKAIMIFESDLNPKARNPKSSAYGLGQTIKSTNKWIHELLGYKDFNHFKTPIPRQVEVTCKYLSVLNKQHKFNTKKVLIAYNGNELGDLYVKKVMRIKRRI